MWPIRRALTVALAGAVLLLTGAWFLVFWLLGSPARARGGPLDVAAQLELLKLVFARSRSPGTTPSTPPSGG